MWLQEKITKDSALEDDLHVGERRDKMKLATYQGDDNSRTNEKSEILSDILQKIEDVNLRCSSLEISMHEIAYKNSLPNDSGTALGTQMLYSAITRPSIDDHSSFATSTSL